MFLSRVRTLVAVAGVAALLGACTGSGRSGLTELQFVGRIPGINSAGGSVVVDGVRANLSSLEGTSLGSVAAGNRLLVIGDSILAGTASRYGGALCSAVVPLGWRVAVEAEAGQLVGFGRTVLRDRIYEGWDAAVVFLGTNYGGSKENYERDLTRIVESLAPRPTLLLTATLFRDSMQQVNEVIRVVASRNSHVSVLDWGTASVQPGLLNKDRVHPTNAGRAVLVSSIASALGTAPETPGACLPAKYTDDSLVEDDVMPATTLSGDTIPYGTTAPVATTVPASSTTSTVAGATTTSVRP
jgi:lysophospholipase L1-like esterase